MTAALDAWAIVAFLRAEPGAPMVRSAVLEGAVASWVNLGEALYVEIRRQGAQRAEHVIANFAQQLLVAEVVDGESAQAAATIKAGGGVSYADCFAVATAERHGVPLLTGDPEILALDRPGLEVVNQAA